MKIFLDVGGHRGETLEVVLSPKFRFDLVHCFEPIPELYEHIRTTFAAGISAGKLQVHNFGLADFTGERNLYGTGPQENFGDGLGASLFADKCDIDASHYIKCRFMSASEFVTEHTPADDFVVLKMNCEGGEILILRDLMKSEQIQNINFMMIDFDIRQIPSQRMQEQKALNELAAVGFDRYMMTGSRQRRGVGRPLNQADYTRLWLSLMPGAKSILHRATWCFIRGRILFAMPARVRQWVLRRRSKLYRAFGLIPKRSK